MLFFSARSPHAISGALQTNHFNCVSAREKPKMKCPNIPTCMMSLLKPVSPEAFLSQKQRSSHIPARSPPVSIMCLSSCPPTTKTRLCPCDPIVAQENLCCWSTRPPISLLVESQSFTSFLYELHGPASCLSWLDSS